MNTTSKTLVATLVIAVLGAAGLVLGQAPEAAPRQEIVKLERVVIEGHRSAQVLAMTKMERLPTVVIEGRRSHDADDVQVARAACPAVTVC